VSPPPLQSGMRAYGACGGNVGLFFQQPENLTLCRAGNHQSRRLMHSCGFSAIVGCNGNQIAAVRFELSLSFTIL
jgi:hypothetical protein